MPSHTLELEVAILGGGIAGLWALAQLRRLGYRASLFTASPLGAGQTVASQGIIHGGVKYALTGAASSAARAIAQMPSIWRESLAAEVGSIYSDGTARAALPLSGARVLSDCQYLWTTHGIASRFAGAAASKAIRTPVARLSRDELPSQFSPSAELGASARVGDVYRVDEPVLDVRSVIQAICQAAQSTLPFIPNHSEPWPACVAISSLHAAAQAPILRLNESGEVEAHVEIRMPEPWCEVFPLRIRAARFILAAGAMNESLLAGLSGQTPPPARMQRRPLHMVMVRSRLLPDLFGHCLGLSDKPRVTITTSRDLSGRPVWYIGGQIAEQGVERNEADQIAAARAEVRACVPWLDLDRAPDAEWSTLRIDRVEGLTAAGARPDEPVIVPYKNTITVWPTKLAFAPLVARKIAELIAADEILPSGQPALITLPLSPPPLAPYPWDDPAQSWTR